MEMIVQSLMLLSLLFTLVFLFWSLNQKTGTEKNIGIFLQHLDSLKTRQSTAARSDNPASSDSNH